MLDNQAWDTAAAVAVAVVDALATKPPSAPVVVNVNVPNCDLAEVKGWRDATVGAIPPRTVKQVRLDPKAGHPGSFHVRMDWGDPVELPPETDGGAVERNEVAISYLTALAADESVDRSVATEALERLMTRRPPPGERGRGPG
jgi:broad specificity polyphosphatase/5'/3'-nucleotidase SurE